MSYRTLSTIHPFIHVHRSAALTADTSNYGGSSVANGFPYDTIDNSGGGLTFNTSTRSITIGVKGLYLVSYSFNIRNDSGATGADNIFCGISVNGTTFKTYYQEVDTEFSNASLRYHISNSIFISFNVNDVIKGYVGDSSSAHDFIASNPGATSLSVALIAPYS